MSGRILKNVAELDRECRSRAARLRIAEWETELAIAKRSSESLKSWWPQRRSRAMANEGRQHSARSGC